MKSQKSVCLPQSDNTTLINTEYELINSLSPDTLVSVIIPIYNEERSIVDILARIPNHRKYEIIVVDDGSTDNSISNIRRDNKRKIRIFKHKHNLGYGAALLTGFKHANGDVVVTMDSDGQHSPEEIPNMIYPILSGNADIVIGSRYLGECHFKIPLYTRLGEFVIRETIWFLYKQDISNSQNGFRAYNRKALKVLKEVKNKGMGFSTEVLFELASNKLKIVEVPMTALPRQYGVSYVNLIKIVKSISFCIFTHLLKKIRINIPKFLKNIK